MKNFLAMAAVALVMTAGSTPALSADLHTWHWTPSPTTDDLGNLLAPAAFYEVFMTCDSDPETLVTVVTDTFWQHEPEPDVTYVFRVRAVDAYGRRSEMSPYSTPWTSPGISATTPGPVLDLGPSYPNPCNPLTTISYAVPADVSGPVEMRVVDLRGRLVRRLPVTDLPGSHTVDWNGTDDGGSRVSSGVYLVHFRCGPHAAVIKVTLAN